MRVDKFSYDLPQERIARHPLSERDAARILLLSRGSGRWTDGHRVRDLPGLLRGDELIIVNNARVFPARLWGRRRGVHAARPGRRRRVRKEHLSAAIEVFLVRRLDDAGTWQALVRPGRKVGTGEILDFGQGELQAEVVARGSYGLRTLRFECKQDFDQVVERLGRVPLPPYIDRADEPGDRERYQTVFARRGSAVAAPTAGMHFTRATLAALERRGCRVVEITLEVGYGTFQPVRTAAVENHRMYTEAYEISPDAAGAIEQARGEGRPVLAVGTTVVRALEDCATRQGRIVAGAAEAELYIYPGYEFKVVNQLLTNFHLPRSSLLILVCAFAGRENVLRAYGHAMEKTYRFYSYGDCMLIR
ncbi:MAG: tRNA preQ1(34) S-adenosylmethionine ribosyltransferase-isomerase QueA [Terriglobia bacterium]